jgi:ferrochelatase
MSSDPDYDAILFVAFGGPEGPDDVMPFLENVLRGRNVPRERMLAVAEHYMRFGGISPLNQQVRELIAAVEPELRRHNIDLPIYWGNRNWHPLLADTLRQMKGDGIKHGLAVVLSAYSSYSGCRQYRENIADAIEAAGPDAPAIDKVRVFYNHPDFIAANVDCVTSSLNTLIAEFRDRVHLAFTAHSIPTSMANSCDYEKQLTETCRLIAEAVGVPSERWRLVYQSRSGRPEDPWLEPDIVDHLRTLHEQGVTDVVVHPVGFLSDHIEVLYDLDDAAQASCKEMGLHMVRSATVGTHPRFVTMIAKLIRERLDATGLKEAVGRYPANWDVCAADCCPAPRRPAAR